MSLDERLSYDAENNVVANFGGWISRPGRTPKLADYLDRWFSRLGRKVHVVVNYDNFYLGPPARDIPRWSVQRGRILSLLPLFDGRFLSGTSSRRTSPMPTSGSESAELRQGP